MIPLPLLGLGGVALLYVVVTNWGRDANSAVELVPEVQNEWDLADIDPRLIQAIGWPYYYGKGGPSTPWPMDGKPVQVDCSGFAQMALVRLGKLSATAPDRSSAQLAADSDPVEVGEQQLGDLAYYPGHVAVVASAPGPSGHSKVLSASGGGRTTLGNDPNARVKVFSSALYRGTYPLNKDGFVTYMRLKQ